MSSGPIPAGLLVIDQVTESLIIPNTTGRCLDNRFLDALGRRLSNLLPSYGRLLNSQSRRIPVLLAECTANASATEVLASKRVSDFDRIRIEFAGLLPSYNGAYLRIRCSNDFGSSWIGSGYRSSLDGMEDSATAFTWSQPTGAYWFLVYPYANYYQSNVAGNGIFGDLDLWQNASGPLRGVGLLEWTDAVLFECGARVTVVNSAAGINAFQLSYNTGNIATGTARLWGIPNGSGEL